MKLDRKNTFTNRIILVDGVGRTGKLDTANKISSLTNVERHRMELNFELIPKLYSLGKIKKDAVVTLLRIEADMRLYENMIGRNVNERLSDMTSIHNYKNQQLYKERAKIDNIDDAILNAYTENPVYLQSTHDAISDANLFFDAFGERLYIIYLIRHPAQIVQSWYDKGFSNKIGENPKDTDITQEYKGNAIPVCANDIKDEYLYINGYERIIGMIHYFLKKDYDGYINLEAKWKNRVKIMDINEINGNQMEKFKEIADFIGEATTEYTMKMIRESGFKDTRDNINFLIKSIENKIGIKYKDMLDESIKIYKNFMEMN